MNKFTIDGSWNQIKGKLRQKFAQLTDDDLNFSEGKSEELLGRLQSKLGMSEDDLYVMLNDLKASSAAVAGGIRQRVDQVKTKATEVAGDIKTRASHVADDLKATANARAEQIKSQAGEVYENVKQRAVTLHETSNEYVRQKPREALFTALAAGFVLGLIIRR